jgi:gamma-glutamylcyclotransferase (GGCT)/AIG2-like uncharacterized protein YtfP
LARANFASAGPQGQRSAATPDLFVYGTLVLDQVVTTLIDRVPTFEATSARGWRVARLPDRFYPGLVPDQHGQAPGRVYLDLSPAEWAAIDAFEDPSYALAEIQVASGRRALAYVWPDDALQASWQLDRLSGDELNTYLNRCIAWRERYESQPLG